MDYTECLIHGHDIKLLQHQLAERDKTIDGLLAVLEKIRAMPTWAHGDQTRLICKEAIARAGR